MQALQFLVGGLVARGLADEINDRNCLIVDGYERKRAGWLIAQGLAHEEQDWINYRANMFSGAHPVLTDRRIADNHRRTPMIMTMNSDPFSPSPRVEVITSVQRRRRCTTAEKVRLVEEAMQPGISVSYVARRAGIAPRQLFAWKRRMLEGGATGVQADDDVVGAGRVRELEKRMRDLERMLGKKTMEVEILKEALDLVASKKPALGLASFDQDGSR